VDILAGKSYSYIVLVTLIVFLSLGAASSILQNHFADKMAQGYLMEYCLSTAIVQVLLSLLVIWIMKRNNLFYKSSPRARPLDPHHEYWELQAQLPLLLGQQNDY